MANYKRKKPKRQSKIYRGGVDGPGCPYCGSNWQFAKYSSSTNVRIRWENTLDGTDGSSWRFW